LQHCKSQSLDPRGARWITIRYETDDAARKARDLIAKALIQRECMVRLRIKWPSAATQESSFLGPDGFPCSAVRFTAGRASKPATTPATAKAAANIFDHDATLGQRKKVPAGKSELAPAPAGPSLSSLPPHSRVGSGSSSSKKRKRRRGLSLPAPLFPFPRYPPRGRSY
jgi:hypothetical protein